MQQGQPQRQCSPGLWGTESGRPPAFLLGNRPSLVSWCPGLPGSLSRIPPCSGPISPPFPSQPRRSSWTARRAPSGLYPHPAPGTRLAHRHWAGMATGTAPGVKQQLIFLLSWAGQVTFTFQKCSSWKERMCPTYFSLMALCYPCSDAGYGDEACRAQQQGQAGHCSRIPQHGRSDPGPQHLGHRSILQQGLRRIN